MNTPRGARTKTVVSLDGKIYFVGYQTDIVERYDPLRNEWQQVASLNEPRQVTHVQLLMVRFMQLVAKIVRRLKFTIRLQTPGVIFLRSRER